jgi:hypothetical protein
MAIVGHTKEELTELLQMSVTDLQFKSKYLAGRILGLLDRLNIYTIGDLLNTKIHVITRTKGFGPEMKGELFAALGKMSIYRDGKEPK